MSRARTPLLLLFLRAPRRGRVKSRLAAGVGEERALAIYRRLAERAAEAARGVGQPLALRFLHTPDDAGEEMRRWLGEAEWVPQGGGDLGERLERAFAAGFADGYSPVLAVGSDLPELGAEELREALRALEGAEAVLGPARDGGYWLIGLTRPVSEAFGGIPWSTERVLGETAQRLEEAGMPPVLLRTLRDVDAEADLPPGW
jgi:uncharacterized protein